ncbi:chemotaxis protein CheW [Paenibacillus woosongensis]|uniref:Chemotaxis protein CheW n=1 Tax=Paenibacillus woosongensis TaxID=307580 RepID=A0AA95KXR1_9BACL|nr:chemotaxis protein CheW [Paenibacillus woosongensis]WHX51325.1 chemotaxis protein CheW [Paenibacillus woosongensis]
MSQTSEQYVVFAINGNDYGIPVLEVSEIIRMQTVNWIPNSRREFLGMIQLREKLIPIISLHTIFSEAEKELDSKTRIIIIHTEEANQNIGIVVDEVKKVMFLPKEGINFPPHMAQQAWLKGMFQQQDSLIVLLDIQTLLTDVNGGYSYI